LVVESFNEAVSVVKLVDEAHFEYVFRHLYRKGAFWEDRYHATAVEKERHLIRCMIYIDLNMVRAGVVDHPSG